MFDKLLKLVPGLEERIVNGPEEETMRIADLVSFSALFPPSCQNSNFFKLQRGSSGARSDDTKSLKSPILDWIATKDQPLRPPLARNSKLDRGFHHERTGELLCPAEFNWADPEYVTFYLPILHLPNSNIGFLLAQDQGGSQKRRAGCTW